MSDPERIAELERENLSLRRKLAECEAALSGEIPPSLRFVLETEAAKILEREANQG